MESVIFRAEISINVTFAPMPVVKSLFWDGAPRHSFICIDDEAAFLYFAATGGTSWK